MDDRRARNIEKLRADALDVLIIGGGINGAGIARDLMMRDPGLRVALLDKNHFASGTSGRNSHLIHGGFRYLRYLQFPLVREALRERATLLRIAGGLVEPLDFLLPCYSPADRWLYGSGLTLYGLLAPGDPLGRHRVLDAAGTLAREPNMRSDHLNAGLIFHDCRVNSTRLVLENLLDAEARGALVANYVEVNLNRGAAHCLDVLTGQRFSLNPRRIVDATGAWSTWARLRLVRGSHLVYPRIQHTREAIAHFDRSGRIVFLIPWGEADSVTLVGTTEVEHHGSPDAVAISQAETDYLSGVVRELFPGYRGEPISAFSSLRPLIADPGRSATANSREHRIGRTPDGVLHVSGGKYTTYRAMSEELVDQLLADLRPGANLPCRTAETPLAIQSPPAGIEARVRSAVEREYARHLQDVLFVSTYWGRERRPAMDWLFPIAEEMAKLLDWDRHRILLEVSSLLHGA